MLCVYLEVGWAELEDEHRRFDHWHAQLTKPEVLDRLHWSEEQQMYCDYGRHSDNVRLVPTKPASGSGGEAGKRWIREVVTPARFRCVPEFGYVSLFPLVTRILEPDSRRLARLLEDLTRPDLLWTEYGLRSLANSSHYHGRYNTQVDPPYWRGQVWMPVNFLVVNALDHYASLPGPSQARAKVLRRELAGKLVKNVHREWLRTGMLWEHYDDQDGRGHGAHPMAGWTALVLLLLDSDRS